MYGDKGLDNTRMASMIEPLSPQRSNILGILKSPKGKAASGPSSTRLSWRLGSCHGSVDKENLSFTSDSTPGLHDGSSILSALHSPPSKRLGQLLASPMRTRHPLEDHDPNSQDSGFGNSMPESEECRTLDSSPSFKAKGCTRVARRQDENETTYVSENTEFSQQVSSYSCVSSTEVSKFTSPSRAQLRSLPSSTPGKKVSPLCSPRNRWQSSHTHSPVLQKSHSSGAESIDDGFLDFLELEKASVVSSTTSGVPSGIGSLLSQPIVKNSEESSEKQQNEKVQSHTSFRRSISLIEGQTPPSSRVRMCLFREEKKSVEKENVEESEGTFGFKRPEPPEGQNCPSRVKRRRFAMQSNSAEYSSPQLWTSTKVETTTEEIVYMPPVLKRSISDSEAVIKSALQRSSTDPDLIGDFTRPYSLPLIPGRHQDLKTITPDTLAALLRGKYDDCVDSFDIIDCRYPYEFEGGHIKGAKNLFTKEQILNELINKVNEKKTSKDESSSSSENSVEGTSENKAKAEFKFKRDILVFHCEFSSERGPSLSRFLRESDRTYNKECYPALHYPEIYLLHGGYKAFFEKHRDLCEPCSYLPMLDARFESDFRYCRAKSKSWTGGAGTTIESSRLAFRGSLKRLGL
ncbi:hypothetical protein J437_LFUL008385 [Ladona fulva]|uniref:protein-tyrosine-phosphatase n=1 Tax=Ladona fulva TaxID=123851 RepID=A0A8K0K4S0_LADFU|nr:hypothetical protein J437_LFUL008385 [Ladona fulva]